MLTRKVKMPNFVMILKWKMRYINVFYFIKYFFIFVYISYFVPYLWFARHFDFRYVMFIFLFYALASCFSLPFCCML